MPLTLADLLNLDPAERAEALIRASEDQWFDRKSGRVAAKDLAKSIVAMANAEGGIVAVGLHNRRLEAFDDRRRNDWRQASIDHVRPPARVGAHEIAVEQDGVSGAILVLEVERSDSVLATGADEVYLRVGDEDRRLTFDQRRELLYDKGQTQYEATPWPQASVADLDPAAIEAFRAAVKGADGPRALMARGLIAPDGTPNVAGLVAFAQTPDRWLPQAVVRVVRYWGRQRLTGARQNIAFDVRFSLPIGALIGQLRTTVLEQIPKRRALTPAGVFAEVGLIPETVWLEAVVNAIIHRSYSHAGDHVRIEIFDDGMVVESPGRLPGVVDLADPAKVRRYARNPRIARVAADLNYGQELGEGVRRMYDDMHLAGLVDPQFFQTAGSLQVVLSGQHIDRDLESRLPDNARALLVIIRERDHPSTGDLADAAGLSRPTVIKLLRSLEAEGLIERIGRGATDPRAFWRIPEGPGYSQEP